MTVRGLAAHCCFIDAQGLKQRLPARIGAEQVLRTSSPHVTTQRPKLELARLCGERGTPQLRALSVG